jgi:hypothetical protein
MDNNCLFRKGLTAGIIFLFFGIIFVPSLNADSSSNRIPFRNSMVLTSLENRSYVNLTLPTVHISYELNKWKWGVVEFDEFNPDFDLNYSYFGTDWVFVGFNETVQCYTQAQLLPAWYEIAIELFCNGSFIDGMSIGSVAWSKWNWTSQEHMAYFAFMKELYNNTDIQGRITVTGYPLRLFFLSYLSLPISLFWWFIDGRFLPPFLERHGMTAEFTIHVHS